MVWLPPCFPPPQAPRHESPPPPFPSHPPHSPSPFYLSVPVCFSPPVRCRLGSSSLSLSLAQCPPPTHIPHPSVGSSFLLLHPFFLAAPRQFTEFSPLTRSQSVLALVFRFGVCVYVLFLFPVGLAGRCFSINGERHGQSAISRQRGVHCQP